MPEDWAHPDEEVRGRPKSPPSHTLTMSLGHNTHRTWPRPARMPASGPNAATWEPGDAAGVLEMP